MKIDLTPEAKTELDRLSEKITKANPFADLRRGPLLSALILEWSAHTDTKQIEALASRLVTSDGLKKSLLNQVKTLSQDLDEKTIKSLQSILKRYENNTRETS